MPADMLTDLHCAQDTEKLNANNPNTRHNSVLGVERTRQQLTHDAKSVHVGRGRDVSGCQHFGRTVADRAQVLRGVVRDAVP